jgi:hypothetical protein
MIRLNQSTHQIRIDTTIKIIEKDGTEITAPVVVLVGLKQIKDEKQYAFYKIANSVFNKEFRLDRIKLAQAKETPVKKAWWKVW